MSYTSLNYHVVFSTKSRKPLLTPDILKRACHYMGGIIRQLNGKMLVGNGQPDHVHLAAVIPPTIQLADLVGKVKSNTTGWIHRTFPALRDFRRQDGYAAVTMSPSVLKQVEHYIRSQQQHHKTTTFKEELIALLEEHGIEYDAKYLWA